MYRTTDAGGLNEPDTAPIAPVWSAHRLGGGELRVPRREAQSLGLVPNRRELCPDALAILPGDDPGSDPLFGRPRLRPWHRPVGSDAILRDGRRPDRLPVLVLSVPHPDGPDRLEPLRRPRAPEDRPLGRPGVQRRRGAPAPRRRA